MYCHFCGKNFESSEGFEEVTRSGKRFIRCERCAMDQNEEEYDWQAEAHGRGHSPQE